MDQGPAADKRDTSGLSSTKMLQLLQGETQKAWPNFHVKSSFSRSSWTTCVQVELQATLLTGTRDMETESRLLLHADPHHELLHSCPLDSVQVSRLSMPTRRTLRRRTG